MKNILTAFLFVAVVLNLAAQNRQDKGLQAITIETVEAPLKFLASDWTEGREVGTKGAYMAADYIASVFQMYGIKPLGDMTQKSMSREFRLQGKKPEFYRSYFQNFDLITETRNKKSELRWSQSNGVSTRIKKLTEGADYQVQGRIGSLEFDAPIVFLGYGIKNKDLKCDPYKKVELKGKIAFILTGFAGINDQESRNYRTLNKDNSLSTNKLERTKIENAREAGAIAIIKYNPGHVFKAANPSNLPMFSDNEFYEGDQPQDDFYLKKIFLPNWETKQEIPVIQLNKNFAESILKNEGGILNTLQNPDYDMAKFTSHELKDSRLQFKINHDQKVIRARNVLGYIEGENTDEVVVIGGHYDHVGKYNGFIFNGADDNASGTVGMLTLARAIKESGKKPAKSILFAAWTGEEQGLWGSKYFVKNIPDNLNIVLDINMDMIGRTSIKDDSEAYLKMQYTKQYPIFEKIFQKQNEANNLNLDIRFFPSEQPKGGSDFVPFAAEQIPIISLFTGLHRHYHYPNDELEYIDLEKMTNIIKLTYLGLNEILESE
ncbi:M20/M25/M40 family metallo-hydrolase [Saccharicrinis sp. 156]|uniref:M20/M25/M40 family metallo-hydrolase n=1 Tax=Saccharicrinis sp. 156 TaxID=3417574 RepID=UPI003D34E617